MRKKIACKDVKDARAKLNAAVLLGFVAHVEACGTWNDPDGETLFAGSGTEVTLERGRVFYEGVAHIANDDARLIVVLD